MLTQRDYASKRGVLIVRFASRRFAAEFKTQSISLDVSESVNHFYNIFFAFK
jgi:hypothetical protein